MRKLYHKYFEQILCIYCHIMSYINIRGVISMKEGSKNLLSSGQVAERLGLSKPHIYTLAAQGKIRSIKFGRAVRFDPQDVEDFIWKHRRETSRPKDAA